ncbi:cob(I)yrinic acid a,c-diamide adenosyltransferase [Candidatus Phycosocius spiralis]|uniref:Corrinoid adenosyltransferase n=1 Tax=Candidatus Phycosocius spiralis TaxID=2815099 RepID=A0ABQ4PUR1_9PROT|nr:cob(I)yrinic acid a,c-diamide adenosyltransferase [Candidatus Phycosocius spiralis]GIU66761.1 cob(I)yrinic acid a,c-diamide adenosyltransferase [Candidatus Phycosocius spiralis]
MVKLNKIYTRTGDDGTTSLATGEKVPKFDARVEAYGSVDEANATIGVARLYVGADTVLDAILGRIQNDLFDLGADLATPERGKPVSWEALRILPNQVERLELEIDEMNATMAPLNSFVLPGGAPLSAYLHTSRTVTRRAERQVALLMQNEGETVSACVLHYLNRLSDLLFVAARRANANGAGDVKWVPGLTRA